MLLTKNDMARVIVQALFGLDALPPSDHLEVQRLTKRKKVELEPQHKKACAILHKKALTAKPAPALTPQPDPVHAAGSSERVLNGER